jgi:hypothetical protein
MDYRKKALKYQKRYNELLQMRGGAGRPFEFNPKATEFVYRPSGHSAAAENPIEHSDDEFAEFEEYMREMEQEEEREIFLEEASRTKAEAQRAEDAAQRAEDAAEHQRIQALIRAQDQAAERARRQAAERARRQAAEIRGTPASASSEFTLTPVIPSEFLKQSPQPPRSSVREQLTAPPRSRTPERVREGVTATPMSVRQPPRSRTPERQVREVVTAPPPRSRTPERVPEMPTAPPQTQRQAVSKTNPPPSISGYKLVWQEEIKNWTYIKYDYSEMFVYNSDDYKIKINQ